jgi:PAS domain S-box-containing protein
MASQQLYDGEGIHSQRKRSEEISKDSEILYRLLAENVTDVMWIMDMDLRFTYLSPSIMRQIGYSVEEAMALSLEEILTSASVEIALKAFTEEMAIENIEQKDLSRSRTLELEQCCKDGSTIWTELEVTFLRDSHGNANGVLGVSRDITERKMAEEEKLRAVTERAALIDAMGEGLLIISMEGEVISCNPALERLCGYTKDYLIGKDGAGLINILVKSEDRERLERLSEKFAAALTAGISGDEYFTLISRDGRDIPVTTTETLVVDGKGNPTAIIAMFKDITGIRQAETAQWESQERLQDFLDNANDLIQSVAPDGRLLYVNRKWRETLGYTEGEIVGLSLFDIIHPDSLAHCKEVFQRVIAGERVNHIEAKFVAKDGGVIMIEGSANCRFEDGKPIATRGIFRDITERKIAEEALRHIYVSPSIERLRGYSVEEALAETIEDFLTPASLEVVMEALAEEMAIENQEQKDLFRTRTLELEMTCKDGSTVWTENTVSPLRDKDGQLIGIVGVARDITERKRADDALRDSEEKLRSFMDSATDFFTIWDSELNLIDLNEASLRYPTIRHPDGDKKEDFIGRNILELDPDIKERGRYDQYLEVIRTGKPLFVEDVVCRPKLGDAHLSVRAFKVGDGLGLLTMDMTEYKRTDEMLRQAEKLRALGEMAGGVAHDFNNILSVVLGRAQLALADVKDEKARRSIQIIEQTALDAAVMVRRLREVAVVKGERSFDEVDLNQLIEDAMQMVESRRLELEETAGVTIEIHTKCNEVSPAAGDAAELREAMVNILFNAMDAMPEGGNITMGSRQEDSSVVLSVSDTGMGIPEEIRGKLFDPFFSTKASKGSGLGLSVTMGIIQDTPGR